MSGLLRICTAGSVDDGKSTLIGRLLYDSRAVYEDQVASVEKASKNRMAGPIDFSLFTDGLKAEREQGITIDVAYRYFATARRKFILADTPGHEQYTRNMATGASTADVAILLVDARNGVRAQTRRHARIAQLLGITEFALAVNKMDLVDFGRPGAGRRDRHQPRGHDRWSRADRWCRPEGGASALLRSVRWPALRSRRRLDGRAAARSCAPVHAEAYDAYGDGRGQPAARAQ